MKRLLFGAALTLLMGVVTFASTSTPELMITDGSTVTVVGSGGSVSYINSNFGGWNIVVVGASNSPGTTPFSIDLTTLAVECMATTCSALTVELSDIGYTVNTTSSTVGYTATDTGAAASTSVSGYFSTTNGYFATTTPIGTVGPFVGFGVFAGSVTGPGTGTSAATSRTLVNTFAACSGAGCASYSSDSDITGSTVPEPASVALFGTGLVFCASRLRRRKAS